MSDKHPKDEIPQDVLEAALQEAQKNPVFKTLVALVDEEISQHVRNGTMTREEAMEKVMELAKNPSLNAMIQLEAPPSSGGETDFFYQEDPSKLPQINPLLAAQMMERLQFDGDIPEFRGSGHMQEGAVPAVPVDTMAVSPLVIGAQLEQASKEVSDLFEENIERLKPLVAEEARVMSEADGALVETEQDFSLVADVHSRREIDPDGYERGKVPALRKVSGPSASDLVVYSPEKRRELAWKSYSTTQGRRSSLKAISAFLERKLKECGIDVVEVLPSPDSSGESIAMHTWTISISGEKNTNSGFAPVAMAQAVLGVRLLEKIPEAYRERPLRLWVSTIDAYSERTVGWSAGLVPVRSTV